MNNTSLPHNETQTLQTQIEELRLKNELMELSIDLAFKERMYLLLKNLDSDPELLLGYLSMHEKRQAQRLKEFVAKLKARKIEQDEELAERRLLLAERKQILNEKKFQHKTQDLPDEASTEPAPKRAPATAGAQPQPSVTASIPVKSPAPAPRAETTATR